MSHPLQLLLVFPCVSLSPINDDFLLKYILGRPVVLCAIIHGFGKITIFELLDFWQGFVYHKILVLESQCWVKFFFGYRKDLQSSDILRTLGILTTSKGCWVFSSLKMHLYPQSALPGKALLGYSCSWSVLPLKQSISSLSNLILAMLL